ncbi:TIGR03943 family putative permease subunit [Niallia nealsonii]|uniref:TIGR03943 family protein n=1 Tax=Niallia nealsonii TaxID=115979 RepID=A0A2N0Z2V3_9BACI|nr:TIGR03943 family protein [Niallia nealsonii]PKG23819.1 TIGR03943 family protein [Niallia nealsonii]
MKISWSPNWQLSNELQGIVLISFSLLLFKLFVKNMITMLVAPKLVPFLLISMVVMFMLGFFRLLNSNLKGADCDCDVCDQNTSTIKQLIPYLLFFSPLFFFFTIEDFSINKDLLSTNGYISETTNDDGRTLNMKMEDEIIVKDTNFFSVMDLLNNQLDDAVGRKIVMNGYIYREEGLKNNEAVLARKVMTHCVADLSIYGYMLNGDLSKLKTGDWYTITATIQKKEIDGTMMPVLKVQKVEKSEKPLEEYIYDL